MGWYFVFFFISGFCGILYEVIWLRLAMAQFGITSALVAIVLSMFMTGLGIGSWASGLLVHRYGSRAASLGLRLYALTELLIGISALLAPLQLQWGRALLKHIGSSSSGTYYLASGIAICFTLVPWCACMGATIPVAMESIKRHFQARSVHSFSYLYLANVLGATAGALLPLLLIEIYGFHGTLKIGAALNALLALSAFTLSVRHRAAPPVSSILPQTPTNIFRTDQSSSRRPLVLLFATGLTSMGLEVVWIRQFTPYLGTMVYAFASILGLYLASTFIGSRIYRAWSKRHAGEPELVWLALGSSAVLPLAAADPHLGMLALLRPLLGIAPFSMILGFITPLLVDRWSGGNPDRAGIAYATNVAGCILGPLLSGFLLLPLTSEHWVICIFAFPWLALGLIRKSQRTPARRFSPKWVAYVSALLALQLVWVSKDYESQFPKHIVFRDSTATVVATTRGGQKELLVNGIGMTALIPVTKMMAHLPMASLNHAPHNALAICFGMGTSFRSLLSWGVPTTAVELVPSVPRVFPFYHADGARLLQSPLAKIVIDDGRRFLERSPDQFDVIVVDPPPPVEAAGSGMLYSEEFYAVLKPRLRPGGILQQWLPNGDPVVRSAVARALYESFPYVRLFQYTPTWGYQFLASTQPIANRMGKELVERMPDAAVRDMVEWPFAPNAEQEFNYILQRETSLAQVMAADPGGQAMHDDRPVNEYVFLRNLHATSFSPNALVSWYDSHKTNR